MKIAQTILLVLFISNFSWAQEEAMVWYFGDHAGIDFSSGKPELLINSAMRAEAGCAVICNKAGKLQFYTNGKKVWNRKNQLMPNGFGLNGSQLLNQNSIIIPLSDSLYYLFTVDAYSDSVGLNYSVVNMKRESGDGDVVLKNQLIRKDFVEKIAATKHCNGDDTWIITHDRENTFYCYLLSSQGTFLDTVVSQSGTYVRADIGYMKVSPASNMLAFPVNNDSIIVEVFRFDNRTGEVVNPKSIYAKDETVYAYGLEFSPDGTRFYINTGGKKYRLWQYDMTAQTEQEVNSSATLLAGGNLFAMQLAPDGKIYIAKQNRDYLSAINMPNELGEKCAFQENAMNLQSKSSLMGLPNFIASYFYQPGFSFKGTCLGDTTHFLYNQYLNSDSVVWSFGDGSPSVSIKNEPIHQYQTEGTFEAKFSAYQCNKVITATKTVEIFSYPKINLGNDTAICNTCELVLDGGEGMDFWIWQDGTETRFYEAKAEGDYHVRVSRNGCESTDSVSVSNNSVKLLIPNAFTPNGDGINDEFKPVFKERPFSYKLIIFDRNAQLLFQTTSVDEGWNGKFNGVDCQLGVYVYTLVYSFYENNILYQIADKGTLALVR
ncbi:MAG TPA: T9SS type B sorting domain-containing protein [Bacteroidales bacterium]